MFRHAAQCGHEATGFTTRGAGLMDLIRHDEIPLLFEGPLGEGWPPNGVVVDDDNRRHATRLGKLDLPLGLRLLGADAGKRIVERDHVERRGGVSCELRLPDLDHPQWADDQDQLKAFLGAQVDGHRGFPGAHGGGDHGATLAAGVEATDEADSLTLVAPGSGSEDWRLRRDHAGCNSWASAAASTTVSVDFSPMTATTRWRSMAMWWRRR